MSAKEFHVKQGLLSIADNFSIKTSCGKDVYRVKGNAMHWGKQSSFQTMDGTELASLKETTKSKLNPYKTFEWFKNGELWAVAKEEDWGVVTKKEISVAIPGEKKFKVVGDRMSWHFQVVTEDGTKAGEIDKQWGITDNYGVRVEEGADEVDVLLVSQ